MLIGKKLNVFNSIKIMARYWRQDNDKVFVTIFISHLQQVDYSCFFPMYGNFKLDFLWPIFRLLMLLPLDSGYSRNFEKMD